MRTPTIRLSDSARRALQEAAVDAGGDPLRMRISDRFNHDLFFGLRAEGDPTSTAVESPSCSTRRARNEPMAFPSTSSVAGRRRVHNRESERTAERKTDLGDGAESNDGP